ncbi:MAG: DNA-directed RNA polymerase subunit P [Candidatus Aenigmarchaeota archaeon]|nr:DNA-directed RNA polymerase subunit P [Candidatus Aenigmarchaeota archaeon]MCK5321864.1 DNA-directed RNA polymerase subunit P [Candidatus Aenigmarchaeota archaeon]
MTKYICSSCRKYVEFLDVNTDLSCPFCSSRIFFKERPNTVKTIKAR